MWYARYLKRIFDFTGALLLIVVFSWLFLAIILLYVITMKFPVFFSQQRIGKGERAFTLFKFRTLKDSAGPLYERRFFPGNVIRRMSLDELPQLWNVLRGDMSLIGPRPLPIRYLPLFSADQRIRHSIRPGVTGWAQVNGRHGIPWHEKFALDNYYVRNVSFSLDLKILFKTIRLLLSFKPDVSLEEKPFTGER